MKDLIDFILPHLYYRKTALQVIFYAANSVGPKVRSRPDNRDFCGTDGAKIHKRNRLLGQ
jgi:hypothetical protein